MRLHDSDVENQPEVTNTRSSNRRFAGKDTEKLRLNLHSARDNPDVMNRRRRKTHSKRLQSGASAR